MSEKNNEADSNTFAGEFEEKNKLNSNYISAIEYFEDSIAMSQEMIDPDATDAETGLEVSMQQQYAEIRQEQEAVNDLRLGKPEKALAILRRQLAKAEKYIDKPFWYYRPGYAPTDPVKIEQGKKEMRDRVARLQRLTTSLEQK